MWTLTPTLTLSPKLSLDRRWILCNAWKRLSRKRQKPAATRKVTSKCPRICFICYVCRLYLGDAEIAQCDPVQKCSSTDQHALWCVSEVEDLLDIVIPPRPEPIMSSDGSGSRLIITKIVADNFKSYFGRHVIGPFHKVRPFRSVLLFIANCDCCVFVFRTSLRSSVRTEAASRM